jgi:hypothetical protein
LFALVGTGNGAPDSIRRASSRQGALHRDTSFARVSSLAGAQEMAEGGGEKQSGSLPTVFISYESQNVDAAKRICDALGTAGLEVWFDQSELAAGDTWDASIRRQVKKCALFVCADLRARVRRIVRACHWSICAAILVARGPDGRRRDRRRLPDRNQLAIVPGVSASDTLSRRRLDVGRGPCWQHCGPLLGGLLLALGLRTREFFVATVIPAFAVVFLMAFLGRLRTTRRIS